MKFLILKITFVFLLLFLIFPNVFAQTSNYAQQGDDLVKQVKTCRDKWQKKYVNKSGAASVLGYSSAIFGIGSGATIALDPNANAKSNIGIVSGAITATLGILSGAFSSRAKNINDFLNEIPPVILAWELLTDPQKDSDHFKILFESLTLIQNKYRDFADWSELLQKLKTQNNFN